VSFVSSQRAGKDCSSAYGRFTVRGQHLAMLFTDGYSNGAGAQNQPAELFTYGWSLYRGSLTLTAVDGALSPEPLRAKPWLRVSTTPIPDRLDRECRPPRQAPDPLIAEALQSRPEQSATCPPWAAPAPPAAPGGG